MIPGELAADLAAWAFAFAYLFATFRPLELGYPARPGQPFRRPGWATDLAFMGGHYLLWLGLVYALLFELSPWLHGLVPPPVRRAFGLQSGWLQVLEVVVLGDFLMYWGHRLQHRVDWLWRFHAVHHSAEHLDWLAAHREHPLDTVYSATIMNLPAFMMGVGPEAMAALLSFRGLWAIFIHANVDLRLGAFGLVFGAPAFHHWHHSRGGEPVNYGNVSPLMDVLFGTHYDPGHGPVALGLEEPLGRGYLGLLVNPMLPARRRLLSA